MSIRNPFKFGLSPTEPAIASDSDVWSAPLPVDKSAFLKPLSESEKNDSATYGDYFRAAEDFLRQDDMAMLRHAVGQILGKSIPSQAINDVGVYVVKHGAFYHPARIEVSVVNQNVALVLNTAVLSKGRQAMPIELEAVSRLTHELSRAYWPTFYGHGYGDPGDGGRWPMFLGAWLEKFYEFHLSEEAASGQLHVVVWDSARGHQILDDRQVYRLIGNAAEILSYAYHPLTFEAILDWHHAAGDFVVRSDSKDMDLRLITVRNYAPLIMDADADLEAVLDAMVAFVTGMSLRLRLDRLDGIGRLVCYPPEVIPAIWEGFLKGLRAGVAERGLPADFGDAVIEFIKLQGVERLAPFATTLIEKYPPESETRDLLQRNLKSHLKALWAAISA